jgi:hypothetical protein
LQVIALASAVHSTVHTPASAPGRNVSHDDAYAQGRLRRTYRAAHRFATEDEALRFVEQAGRAYVDRLLGGN